MKGIWEFGLSFAGDFNTDVWIMDCLWFETKHQHRSQGCSQNFILSLLWKYFPTRCA